MVNQSNVGHERYSGGDTHDCSANRIQPAFGAQQQTQHPALAPGSTARPVQVLPYEVQQYSAYRAGAQYSQAQRYGHLAYGSAMQRSAPGPLGRHVDATNVTEDDEQYIDHLGSQIAATNDADQQQPQHSAPYRAPFHHLWPNSTLDWPRIAFHSGIAQQPAQLELYISGIEEPLYYWLPRQHEFDAWDRVDREAFVELFESMDVRVQWTGLDGYFGVEHMQQERELNHAETGRGDFANQHSDTGLGLGADTGFPFTEMEGSSAAAVTGGDAQVLMQSSAREQSALPTDVFVAPRQDELYFIGNQNILEAVPEALNDEDQDDDEDAEQSTDDQPLQPSASTDHVLLTFQNSQELQAFRDRSRSPQAHDPSIPTTWAAKAPYVLRLKKAMIDTAHAKGKRGKSYDKRWAGAPNKLYYDEQGIELTARNILDRTVEHALFGPGIFTCYDPDQLAKYTASANALTFEQRIDAIVELLLKSKDRVNSLMKHQGIDDVVGFPELLVVQSDRNRDFNEERAGQLKIAQEMRNAEPGTPAEEIKVRVRRRKEKPSPASTDAASRPSKSKQNVAAHLADTALINLDQKRPVSAGSATELASAPKRRKKNQAPETATKPQSSGPVSALPPPEIQYNQNASARSSAQPRVNATKPTRQKPSKQPEQLERPSPSLPRSTPGTSAGPGTPESASRRIMKRKQTGDDELEEHTNSERVRGRAQKGKLGPDSSSKT